MPQQGSLDMMLLKCISPPPFFFSLNSPGLLDDVVGPHQAAHVPRAVVEACEGLEGAKNGVGQHQYEGPHPGGCDDLGGVGFCLPHPGREGVANGTVALQGDGHQVEGGDAHRDTCRDQKIQTVLLSLLTSEWPKLSIKD